MGIIKQLKSIKKITEVGKHIDWARFGGFVFALWALFAVFGCIYQVAAIIANAPNADFINSLIASNKSVNWASVLTSPLLQMIYKIVAPLFIGGFLYWGFKSSKVMTISERYDEYFDKEN